MQRESVNSVLYFNSNLEPIPNVNIPQVQLPEPVIPNQPVPMGLDGLPLAPPPLVRQGEGKIKVKILKYL